MTDTGTAKPFKLSMKVVVRDEAGRCLLLKRSQASANNKGKWDLPGGKVDPGEDFDEALLREVREETGLGVRLTRVAGSAQSQLPERTVAYLIMEAHLAQGEVALSHEHEEFAWVPPAKLPEMDVCPQFRPFVEQYAKAADA